MRIITRQQVWRELETLDEQLQRTLNEKHAEHIEHQRDWWAAKLQQMDVDGTDRKVLQ